MTKRSFRGRQPLIVFVAVLSATVAIPIAIAQDAAPAPSAPPATSTAASAADVEALRQQVHALSEIVQTLQQQLKDQQAATGQTNPAPAALPQNPEPPELAGAASNPPTPAASASAPALFPTNDTSVVAGGPSSSSAPVNANGMAFPTSDSAVTAGTDATAATSSVGSGLAQPITIAGGGATYINISFDGQFSLAGSTARDLDHIEFGDHDPQQRGFNARNLEIALSGAVDPYFEGFANIVFTLDKNNETRVEVEEAFMQTTSLPFGLQAKAGQFFAAFGRQNPMHPHAWDFADTSIVNAFLLGPDALRGVGAQLSSLAG